MTGPALAAAMAACVLGLALGWVMLRREPQGLEAAGLTVRPRRRRARMTARVSNWLGHRYGPMVLAAMTPGRRAQIAHRLDAAGRPGGITLDGYAARKASVAATMVVLGLALTLLVGSTPLMMLLLGAAAWFGFDLHMARIARRRQQQIDADLPDFMDVLTVSVSAGMSFRAALHHVAGEFDSPLSEEVALTLQQLRLGVSRRSAFDGLRARNDSGALHRFVRELLQAEELGSPLTDALAAIAADMRLSFAQGCRRRAARAQPKVSLIITTLVVPGAVIVVLGGLLLGNLQGVGVIFGV